MRIQRPVLPNEPNFNQLFTLVPSPTDTMSPSFSKQQLPVLCALFADLRMPANGEKPHHAGVRLRFGAYLSNWFQSTREERVKRPFIPQPEFFCPAQDFSNQRYNFFIFRTSI